jgi:DNA-binding MarR family transcriptional regulator
MAPDPPRVPDVDAFVHELARLRLLVVLSVLKRADFVYLLEHTGLSRGNLSVQMSNLSDAGFVEITRQMVRNRSLTVYAITSEERGALAACRSAMLTLLGVADR